MLSEILASQILDSNHKIINSKINRHLAAMTNLLIELKCLKGREKAKEDGFWEKREGLEGKRRRKGKRGKKTGRK